jgi:acyl-CoA thioester hydrolase
MILDTGRAVAHQWMCDHMGHMNTRFYAAIVDDAGFQFLEEIAPQGELKPRGLGWADVSFQMNLRHEVAAGSIIRIRSRLVRIGNRSVTHAHSLVSNDLATEHAAAEIVTVLFDLNRRIAVPLDEAMRLRCEKLMQE